MLISYFLERSIKFNKYDNVILLPYSPYFTLPANHLVVTSHQRGHCQQLPDGDNVDAAPTVGDGVPPAAGGDRSQDRAVDWRAL